MQVRNFLAAALTAVLLVPAVSSCGGSESADTPKTEPLRVMADVIPHAELIQQAEKLGLIDEGLVEIAEISGGVDPNQLVNEGDVDANFFQHVPYLDDWNAKHEGSDLVSVATVHVEPLGLYSNKVDSLATVPQDATIAIPADATNLARALFLLEDAGLVTLDVDRNQADLDYSQITTGNVAENPKNISFIEIERPQLAATLDDPKITLSVINGNYALEAGLVPITEALILEKADNNPYANVLVVKEELKSDERVQKLAEALTSDTLAEWINDTYQGAVLPVNG